MTTILYFFWSGFSGVASVAAVNGPLIFPAAMIYRPGLKAGDVFLPGAKAADVYRPGMKAGAISE